MLLMHLFWLNAPLYHSQDLFTKIGAFLKTPENPRSLKAWLCFTEHALGLVKKTDSENQAHDLLRCFEEFDLTSS
jgi:hypothetical protein